MRVTDRLSPAELLARWKLLQDGDLTIESDSYELNERGDIVVSPRPSNIHQAIASLIALQLSNQLGLLASQDVAVVTSAGILVPDVIWMPIARWSEASRCHPLAFCPDICVEILLPSNLVNEISRKIRAYLAAGAREVILVGLQGEIRYWRVDGEFKSSALGVTLEIDRSLLPPN